MKQLLLWLITCLFVAGQAVVHRKSVHKMSLDELSKFVVGVNMLAMRNNTKLQSITASYAAALKNETNDSPSQNLHYHFLNEFEEAIKAIDDKLFVPFWDWTVYAHIPHLDPVFSNSLFGRESTAEGCLRGNFAGYHSYQEECIKRKLPTPYNTHLSLLSRFKAERNYPQAKSILRTMTKSVQTSFSGYTDMDHFHRDPIYYLLISYELHLLYEWGEERKVDVENPALDPTYPLRNKGAYPPKPEP